MEWKYIGVYKSKEHLLGNYKNNILNPLDRKWWYGEIITYYRYAKDVKYTVVWNYKKNKWELIKEE